MIANDTVRSLYEDYYLKEEKAQEKYISSHWVIQKEKMKVETDDDGNVVSVGGIGFTGLKTKNRLTKWSNYLCILSYLAWLPHRPALLKLIFASLRVCRAMGFYFSYDCFRQVCSLELIMRYMSDEMKRKRLTFLIVGDGYGFLSALLKAVYPDSTIVLVDIGRTLLFQAFHCRKVYPDRVHARVDEPIDPMKADFVYCPTEYLEQLTMFKYDIMVNIGSMQEMNPQTIGRYFSFFRNYANRQNLFYCCNRELKILSGGERLEIRKFPWLERDIHLIDEYCPWFRYFLSRARTVDGPRAFGMRIPFINYFDGRIIHRLSVLSTRQEGIDKKPGPSSGS